MTEFIVSLVVTAMMVGVYHWYDKRTPANKQMTWGEAMIASTYVFAVFFWIYGVVPHFWLQWADGGLNWRADRNFELFGLLRSQANGGFFPFNIPFIVLRDLISVGIYIAFLGANIFYWNHWQTRDARATAAEQATEAPSEFGRPLVREGVR